MHRQDIQASIIIKMYTLLTCFLCCVFQITYQYCYFHRASNRNKHILVPMLMLNSKLEINA